MAPRETKNKAYAKFLGTNKEYYGMLSYFLEWSVIYVLPPYKRDQVNVPPCGKCFLELVLAA